MQTAIFREKLIPSKLGYVMVIVSDKCFFKCKMCSIWENKEEFTSLSIKDYSSFFKDLQNIAGESTEICFTGGEPLTNKNIFTIIKLANNYGLTTILNTNGFLVNDKVIENLYHSGLSSITFSLDGSNSQMHDSIRGMSGSFNKIIKASKKIKSFFNFRKKDITVGYTTVISKLNQSDIYNIIKLANKADFVDKIWLQAVTAPLGNVRIENDKVIDQKGLSLNWYEHPDFKHLWPDIQAIDDLYSKILLAKKHKNKIANSEYHLKLQNFYYKHPSIRKNDCLCTMYKDLYLNTNGDFFLCPLSKSLGNVRYDKVSSAWNSYPLFKQRKQIMGCSKSCHVLLNCGQAKDTRQNTI